MFKLKHEPLARRSQFLINSSFGYIFTTDCTDYTDFSSQEATMAGCRTIRMAGAAVATAILSCDLSIDVADKNDCHDGEDDIYDNFLHSCLNPKSVIRPLRGSVVKQI